MGSDGQNSHIAVRLTVLQAVRKSLEQRNSYGVIKSALKGVGGIRGVKVTQPIQRSELSVRG